MSLYQPVRNEMIRLLSTPRLSTYTAACNGDIKQAVELYQWNLEVSGAIFPSIHYFEVALRNTMDTRLTKVFGTAGQSWFDRTDIGLTDKARNKIAMAKRYVTGAGHTVTHGHVIAELTLGFWWSLLAEGYNDTLWAPALRAGFQNARVRRLHDAVDEIRKLRNRVAHHEPLIHHDVEAEYARILATAEYISPRLAWWIDATSSLSSVLARRP